MKIAALLADLSDPRTSDGLYTVWTDRFSGFRRDLCRRKRYYQDRRT